jgi:hypothetical protein
MAQIIVFDPVLKGSGHSALNAGMLFSLRAAFPKCRIKFLAEKQQIKNVAGHLAEHGVGGIEFFPVEVPSFSEIKNISINAKRVEEIALKHLDPKEANYIILAATRGIEAYYIANLVDRLTPKYRVWAHFMLHGTNRYNLTKPRRILGFFKRDLRDCIKKFKRPEIRFLVLDAATIPEWVKISPEIEGRIGPLEIAILPKEHEKAKSRARKQGPVRFALLGQANKPKGLNEFVETADIVNSEMPGMAEFHRIGRLSSDLKHTPTGSVILHQSKAQERGKPAMQMERKKYLTKIAQMHYFFAFYNGGYYKTGASGVFFDAMNMTKPVITTPIPIVEELSKTVGGIGEICHSKEEMLKVIKKICKKPDWKGYAKQEEQMKKARQKYLPKAVAQRFKLWLMEDSPGLFHALDGQQ